MQREIFEIEPILEERIWGGRALIDKFHLETDLENVAELYSVIAIPNHLDCVVKETNQHLSDFYLENKNLFGCKPDHLPVRLVAGHSVSPLSVQLHPEDDYGLKHSGMRGKAESEWILGDSNNCGELILGHHAKTKEEFIDMVTQKNWDQLFRKINVRGGDFINIPTCTLHGSVGEGEVVAFSTNGDVTYRLYDYDRIGKDGLPRELHVQEIFDNVRVPDNQINSVKYTVTEKEGCLISDFFDQPGLYTCGSVETFTKGVYEKDEFIFLFCIEGKGKIEAKEIKAGKTFFIPCNHGPVHLEGKMKLAYISYKDKE